MLNPQNLYTRRAKARITYNLCLKAGCETPVTIARYCPEHLAAKSRSTQARRARRRAARQCVQCGIALNPTDGLRCTVHAAKARQEALHARTKLKAETLCVVCRQPTVLGLTRCRNCALKRSQRWQRSIAQQICGRCRKQPVRAQRTTCESCAHYLREYGREYRTNNKETINDT